MVAAVPGLGMVATAIRAIGLALVANPIGIAVTAVASAAYPVGYLRDRAGRSPPDATDCIAARGVEITVAFGYLFAAQVMGVYIAEEVEIFGPPGQMRITGYAAAHGKSDGGKSPISTARTRSWPEGTKVSAMVGKIAGESGFKVAVSAGAGEVSLPHIDQIDESDMNLLTRVARDQGLIFKPGGGALVMCKPGESASASGQALPVVALTPKDVTSWSMRRARRAAFDKVVAAIATWAAASRSTLRPMRGPRACQVWRRSSG
ncbi:phage late control D family protein [Paracoccus sp. DMF]|uniref:phage late control D family protein n=1 Tax=Paracoccus sp. DMF TaxID=400837 RepID=UPI0021E4D7E0|nr:contractile injection system protein, VgrG/Pvc8 family [Paracoccus sp. DMF]MCV2448532.1 contractile injection system protein, VgrG/Pvc8 family [Paracoccus sp. DMF]